MRVLASNVVIRIVGTTNTSLVSVEAQTTSKIPSIAAHVIMSAAEVRRQGSHNSCWDVGPMATMQGTQVFATTAPTLSVAKVSTAWEHVTVLPMRSAATIALGCLAEKTSIVITVAVLKAVILPACTPRVQIRAPARRATTSSAVQANSAQAHAKGRPMATRAMNAQTSHAPLITIGSALVREQMMGIPAFLVATRSASQGNIAPVHVQEQSTASLVSSVTTRIAEKASIVWAAALGRLTNFHAMHVTTLPAQLRTPTVQVTAKAPTTAFHVKRAKTRYVQWGSTVKGDAHLQAGDTRARTAPTGSARMITIKQESAAGQQTDLSAKIATGATASSVSIYQGVGCNHLAPVRTAFLRENVPRDNTVVVRVVV